MSYKCGHMGKPVFIKKSIVEYTIYIQWKDSDSELCFDCWNKKRIRKLKGDEK